MTGAKLTLPFLFIVAVLGFAFAFKARNFTQHFVYTGTLGSGVCQTLTPSRAITAGTKNFAASTISLATGCGDQKVIVIDNP